jgi:hypothetical protein
MPISTSTPGMGLGISITVKSRRVSMGPGTLSGGGMLTLTEKRLAAASPLTVWLLPCPVDNRLSFCNTTEVTQVTLVPVSTTPVVQTGDGGCWPLARW